MGTCRPTQPQIRQAAPLRNYLRGGRKTLARNAPKGLLRGAHGATIATTMVGHLERLAPAWSMRNESGRDRFDPVPLVLAIMLLVGFFDLGCTITAYEHGQLVELNPLADSILAQYGSPGLALFRFIMTALACVGLNWALRTYQLRYHLRSDIRRIRTVVHSSLAVVVTSHAGLLAWWLAWLSA